MSKATDHEILAWALRKNAIIVTFDADFHTILAVSGASGPSVIRLRMQGLHAPAIVQLIHNVFADFDRSKKRLPCHDQGAQDHMSPSADWQFRTEVTGRKCVYRS